MRLFADTSQQRVTFRTLGSAQAIIIGEAAILSAARGDNGNLLLAKSQALQGRNGESLVFLRHYRRRKPLSARSAGAVRRLTTQGVRQSINS
jgi:hypothetical protein